jgi:phage I-like protein
MMKRAAIEIDGHLKEALHGPASDGAIALMGMDLPNAASVPEWVHLLPAGPVVDTHDGRGPYRLDDPAAVVTASLQAMQARRLPLDENHSTDIAAPQGLPAPARGWFTGFEVRSDGIWGKVDWTEGGKALMADRAYGGISPVILFDPKTMRVLAITRASLINKPNLKGLTALHGESDMDLLKLLAARLGLADTSSQDAVLAAVDGLKGAATALQGQLAPIAKVVGLADGATAEAVLGAVTKLKTAPAGGQTIEALQAELSTMANELNTLKGAGAKAAATAFVDRAIAEKRVGVVPLREHYIAMHMEDPARVEKEINSFPKLGTSSTTIIPPTRGDGTAESLNTEETQVAKLLGIAPKDFAATRDKTEAAA